MLTIVLVTVAVLFYAVARLVGQIYDEFLDTRR